VPQLFLEVGKSLKSETKTDEPPTRVTAEVDAA
jgi:hypothetical protein